jgi:hypothetical protein
MPNKRYERRELTHKWEDIRPLLKDSAHVTYEIIRPVVLFGVSPKECAEETGVSKSSIIATLGARRSGMACHHSL